MILLPLQRSCQALIESERQMQFSHCIHHVCYLYLSHNSRNTIWSGCISGITNTHASCSLLQVDTLKTFLNELDICQLKSCVLTTLDNSKSEWKWTGNCHHSLKLNPFVNIEGGRALDSLFSTLKLYSSIHKFICCSLWLLEYSLKLCHNTLVLK